MPSSPITPLQTEAHRPLAFTPEERLVRAVRRRDLKRDIAKMLTATGRLADANFVLDNRAPHANRGTVPRRHYAKVFRNPYRLKGVRP